MAAAIETVAECPTCGASVGLDAPSCPSCGQAFADVPPPPAEESLPTDEPEEPEDAPARAGLREKFLFYVGIFLILLGGPGIALGSWLHDVLRISVMNYNSFDVFGPVNRLVVALGLIVMIVGVVFFILALRLSRPAPGEEDLVDPDAPDDAAL